MLIAHGPMVGGLDCRSVDRGNLSQMRLSAKKLLRDRGHVHIYKVMVSDFILLIIHL